MRQSALDLIQRRSARRIKQHEICFAPFEIVIFKGGHFVHVVPHRDPASIIANHRNDVSRFRETFFKERANCTVRTHCGSSQSSSSSPTPPCQCSIAFNTASRSSRLAQTDSPCSSRIS